MTFVNDCTRTRLTGHMLVVVNLCLLDNPRLEAGERFAALAELFDPWTFRHLDDLKKRERGSRFPDRVTCVLDPRGGQVRHVRDQLPAAYLATPDQIDRHLENLARDAVLDSPGAAL